MPTRTLSFSSFTKRVLAALAVALLLLALWAARPTLLYGFAAAVLAVGISLPAGWLQRHGVPRGWAIAASALGVFVVTGALLVLVLPRLLAGVVELVSGLPGALDQLEAAYAELRARGGVWQDVLPPLDDGDIEPGRASALMQRIVEGSLAVAPAVLGGVSTLMVALAHLGVVIFVALFFVVDPTAYVRGSLYLMPERSHERAVEVWNELYATVRSWITALSLSITVTTILVWLILGVILGMPNALVVAVFAGLATFIPNIGSVLPIIPIVVFTLVGGDPSDVLIYVPVYLGIQLLESNVLTPSIVKSQLSIPAGVVLLFQLVVTVAFGALGLLLAVPLLACLIVLVREIYSYDVLDLDRLDIALTADATGVLRLEETPRHPAPTAEVQPPEAMSDPAPVAAPLAVSPPEASGA